MLIVSASLAAAQQPITFVQLTDPHIFDSGKRGTDQEKTLERAGSDLAWRWALTETARIALKQKIDFVVLTGDLGLEGICRDHTSKCSEWNEAVNRISKDFSVLPVASIFILRGNNDLPDEKPTEEGLKLYGDFVSEVSKQMGNAQRLIDLTSVKPESPTSFGGFRIVGLDSSSFKNSPNNPDKNDPCMNHVPDIEWVKVAKLNAQYQHKELERVHRIVLADQPTLLFTHIPNLDDPFRAKSCQSRFGSWNLGQEDLDLWADIITRSAVIAVFAGHFHDDKESTYRPPYTWLRNVPGQSSLEKTFISPPLAAKFQTGSRQARGFLLATVTPKKEIAAELHWFNAAELSGLPDSMPPRNPPAPTPTEEGNMTTTELLIILAIIVVAGILGGIANYILLPKDSSNLSKDSSTASSRATTGLDRFFPMLRSSSDLVRSVFLGIVASLLAPLFLKTISSDLITTLSKYKPGNGIPFDFFVFMGFCLLAAVFSRHFLDTISKRLLADVERANQKSEQASAAAISAEQRLEKADPVLRSLVERYSEPGDEVIEKPNLRALESVPLDDRDQIILKALEHEKYSFRTVDGIAKSKELNPNDVEQRLKKLREQKYVGQVAGLSSGRELWFLTGEGHDLLLARKSKGAADSKRLRGDSDPS